MSNEHTPTPWVVGERKLPYGDGTKFHTERWICTEWIHPQLKAQYPIMTVSLGVGLRGENPYYLSHMEAENAAHIVKCVNAHDALVEALQSIVDMCNEDSHARDYASRQTEIRGTAIVALRKIQRSQMNNDLDQWKPYLKEGETPFERFVRDRADTDALLELYKKAIAAAQDQDAKDAARFRWLEQNVYQGVSRFSQVLWCIRGLFGKDGESFREAIDDAMYGTKK